MFVFMNVNKACWEKVEVVCGKILFKFQYFEDGIITVGYLYLEQFTSNGNNNNFHHG